MNRWKRVEVSRPLVRLSFQRLSGQKEDWEQKVQLEIPLRSSALSLPMVGRAPPVLRAVYNRVTRHPSRPKILWAVEGRRNSTYEAA